MDSQDCIKFEKEFRKLMTVTRLDDRVYLLESCIEDLKTSKNPVAFLPFCIKDPGCGYRKEYDCDFSLTKCKDDQTKDICEILETYDIPYCFNNRFVDVGDNIKKFKPMDLFIIPCCPEELLEIKEGCYKHMQEQQCPSLIFLLTDYEKCRLQEQSRLFEGQTKLNLEQFKRTLKIYFSS
jgi:hypothetical protein